MGAMRADDVEIGRPCPIDLRERIAAAAAEFHCDHCDRPVHVLSHMSEEAAAQVLARRQRDNLCVALLRAGDGRVHFRGDGEVLVPTSRLGAPRMMLRASALALTMAACTSNDVTESAERVEPPSVSEPPSEPPRVSVQPFAHAEINEQEFEVLAGVPPLLDEFEQKQPCGPNGEPIVDYSQLQPISTPDVPSERLLATKRARRAGREIIELRFCIDKNGRVRNVEHLHGDKQIAKLYVTRLATWRFEPYKVDGRKTAVCTTYRALLDIKDTPA